MRQLRLLAFCVAIPLISVGCGSPVRVVEQGEPKPPPPQQPDSLPEQPYISIIIDDIGNDLENGRRALRLPAQITLSILPHTPFSQQLDHLALYHQKEVMLHLPMQALNNPKPLGPGGLNQQMNDAELRSSIRDSLKAVPNAVGVNNHMGSLLTSKQGPMNVVMEELAQEGNLFFVDSRTTHHTLAYQSAVKHGIPAESRDMFLDNQQDEAYIRQQLLALVERAKTEGSALGIAHPYDATLNVLEKELDKLREAGINIIPVSKHVKYQTHKRQVAKHGQRPRPPG